MPWPIPFARCSSPARRGSGADAEVEHGVHLTLSQQVLRTLCVRPSCWKSSRSTTTTGCRSSSRPRRCGSVVEHGIRPAVPVVHRGRLAVRDRPERPEGAHRSAYRCSHRPAPDGLPLEPEPRSR
jgi:hypothetical protein